mmetsp:Transcript_10534/g.34950  ORF Transcript_10534/g.34950 Transcript_10534/m.34950 type:complete len:275 (+) Transcript_10534:90-914(+)
MRGVFAQLPMQRLPAVSALRRLSSASGSDAGGGGILERASAAVGLGEASRTRAAAKMAEARERGVSWTEATSEAMRDVRKERRSESLREFYEGLAAAPTFDLGALRAQYEEGLAAEDKMTATQRMGLRFDQLRGGEQAQALDEMKAELRTSLAILDAMTPAEARSPLELVKASRAAKERIVGQVGLSSDAPIKSVLMQFEWSLIQHEFLRRERLAGRTLPRTQEEMEWMLRQRPTSRAFRMLRSESMRMQGRMRASKVARPRGFAAERGLRLVN